MKKVIFSSWAGKVVDNREQDIEKYRAVKDLAFPLEYDGHQIGALMSWQGLVVTDGRVNIIDMVHSYLKEVQKLCCGECNVGYAGIKVMLNVITRILNGNGAESDIELLLWLGSSIKENARCSFCATAVTPVLDTLDHYQQEYLKLIAAKKAVPKAAYAARVSAPCIEACPAHQDIPGYIELIKNRRYSEALEVIRQTNCLPGVTGRACAALCEASCVRGDTDSPVAIRALKRVAADDEMTSGLAPRLEKTKDKEIKVAVIGAGPAGLACSYKLALMGYKVVVYDEQPSGGGMALTGIPAYRLPREIISREVETVQRAGVEFRFNTRVGRDITLDTLYNNGFRAIFIATGAHQGRELGIEGEAEAEDTGLIDGVKFLREVNENKRIAAQGKAAVIGGGNVAIDCARTCVRLGFKQVTIIYRRSRAEMPGRKEEVEEAEKEGVNIRFLATPVKILTHGGRVTGVECIAMELGEPDASGRKRPVPIPGSEFVIETDMVLPAIGEKPDLSYLTKADRVETTADGTIRAAPDTGQTSQSGVFSGGDCVTGPATLIEAIAAGNRAAAGIDRYLRAGKTSRPEEDAIADLVHSISLSEQRDEGIVVKSSRYDPPQLPIRNRVKGFGEVEKVLAVEAAIGEAERCRRCYRVMLLATD